MWDYVKDVYLRYISADARIICHHPVYKAQGLVLDNVKRFKNHVAIVYKVALRPPRVFYY